MLRGGSNEYPQSMFLSRNKKNNVYPCKPQFYCIKVGFKGMFSWWLMAHYSLHKLVDIPVWVDKNELMYV